ncbi:hypothetical protein NUM_39850 [Actinocatenispora comari]|uniref:Segregation and condensation protein B n=2 Tax=Actinocatenispora comari TaxID=2807577 RepID=A0A8J4ELP6_9ACTN|nr:hypothetical protein NUM_39850 [Actinocatenispora comari]
MTGSEDVPARDDASSLADRVAAWTPPWARPQPADPESTDSGSGDSGSGDSGSGDSELGDSESAGTGDRVPAAEPTVRDDASTVGREPTAAPPAAEATTPTDDLEPPADGEPSAPAEPVDDVAPPDDVVPVDDADPAGGTEPADGVEPADGMEPAVDVVPGDGVGLGDEVAPVEDGRSARAGEPAGDAEPAEVAAAAGDRASNDDAEPSSPEEPDGAVGTDGDAETPAPSDGAGSDAADEARALPELDDPETLRAALEAILIVVDEPVSEVVLAQVLERPTAVVAAAVRELAESYTQQRRGFELRQAAGGWRIYTRDDFAPYVERFVLDGQQVRLTQAALETLAVVAYKQPVSRSRVSAIRGVNCDGVVRTLLTRGLIEECGAEPESGAYLYRTTTLFLERMGINSTDELPDLAPFLPDELPEEAS